VFFASLYLVFSKVSDQRLALRDTGILIGTVVISVLAILIFYAAHA